MCSQRDDEDCFERMKTLPCLIFRGSIPHPMQSLCTLRSQRRHWLRNTRYQADATPYLGRTSTGWIAPVRLAHSFDDLVGEVHQRRRHVEAERLRGFEIDDELELRWLLDWNIRWLLTFQDF